MPEYIVGKPGGLSKKSQIAKSICIGYFAIILALIVILDGDELDYISIFAIPVVFVPMILAMIYAIYEQTKHQVSFRIDKNAITLEHTYNGIQKEHHKIKKKDIRAIVGDLHHVGRSFSTLRSLRITINQKQTVHPEAYTFSLRQAEEFFSFASTHDYPVETIQKVIKIQKENQQQEKYAWSLTFVAMIILILFTAILLALVFTTIPTY